MRAQIPVIGLVGGIGSGKSFLAQTLANRKNVAIVDGDVIGHEVLRRPEVLEALRDRFGDGILAADGSLQRRALGRLVFGASPEHQRAKQDLEALVHPPLTAELCRQIAAAQAAGQVEAVILDAAVLLETGWRSICDALIFVDVPPEERWRRVAQTRGWSREEFEAREASQLPMAAKRAAAGWVIENFGPSEQVAQRCLQVYSEIMDETSPDSFRSID